MPALMSLCMAVSLIQVPVKAAPSPYTLTFSAEDGYFYANGGEQYDRITITDTDGDGKIKVTYPFVINGKSYQAVRNGFTLASWTSGDTTVTADDLNNHVFSPTSDMTFTPNWTGATYHVTFKSVTSSTVLQKDVVMGENTSLTLAALNINASDIGLTDGQTFIGWRDDATGTFFDGLAGGASIYDFVDDNGNPIFKNSDVSLTAVVADKTTITITYNPNKGSGTETTDTFKYGESKALKANVFTRTNYTFIGWSTNPDATAADYVDRQETYSNFGFTDDTTLYAIWTASSSGGSGIPYTVNFIQSNMTTGSGTTTYKNHLAATLSTTATQYYNSAVADLSTQRPSQQGFYVTGWRICKVNEAGEITLKSTSFPAGSTFRLSSDGNYIVVHASSIGDQTVPIADYLSNDTIYLLPEWGKIAVRFGFAPNAGGAGTAPANMDITLDVDATLPDNTFTHPTKSFMGWALDSSANADNMYTDGATASDNMVYPAGYEVRSSLNSTQTYPLFSDPFSKYLDVTKWESAFATSTYFDSKTGVLDLTSLTKYKIYAVWDDNTYTVHYDINAGDIAGGSGSTDDQLIKVTAPTALTKNGFTLTGYTFKNWNTKKDGSGTSYTDGQSVTGLAKRNETITLYAQWELETIEQIPLQVTQEWDDKNDQDGKRPKNMTYTIGAIANGKSLSAVDLGLETLSYTLKSSESSAILTYAPSKYLADGEYYNIVYRINTSTPTDYTASLSYGNSTSGVTAEYTFAHTPATKNFVATIKISDNSNQDGLRPQHVTITLSGSNGSKVSANVTITGDSSTYTFENLPVYSKGEAITYTLSVNNVSGYTSTTSSSGSTGSITLSHTPETRSANITVQWKDNNDEAKLRPKSISVTLTSSSGTSYKATINGEAWTGTVTNIAKYYQGTEATGALTVTPVTGYTATVSGTIASGFTVNMAMTDIASKYADSLKETPKKAATDTTKKTEEKPVNPKDLRTIKVRTIWNDRGADYLRPLTIKISLVGSDGSSYDKTLTNATSFSATFTDLPKQAEGAKAPIEYKIKYSPISGYTTHVYHNRKNQDEFIIEQFLPEDEPGQTKVTRSAEQQSDDIAPNEIAIGAKEKDDRTITIGEAGDVVTEEDPDITLDPVVRPWTRYLIPGAIGLGALAILAAIILLIRSNKR